MANKQRTLHARKRMQQRAISDTQIRLIQCFGVYEYQKGGTNYVYLPDKVITEIRQALDKVANVRAIYSESDALITVMHETRKTHNSGYTA